MGQLASGDSSIQTRYSGASMDHARLEDPEDPQGADPVTHVVTGTHNGYVYALIPGPRQGPGSGNKETQGTKLSYTSPDLGWQVVGMDVGDVDVEAEGPVLDEIVVGTFLDDGSYLDWRDGRTDRNKGHLYILHPDRNTRTLVPEDIGGEHVGAGVFGVKIDDINGDGEPEIWCGDATGHIWIYERHTSGDWHAHAGALDVGAYPGIYNNFHPIKEVDPISGNLVTTKLVVVSSGYVMAFDVDWENL